MPGSFTGWPAFRQSHIASNELGSCKQSAVTLVALKSHLIMESAIDNIIRLIFFWPNIILDARINFFQKVEIVRAYSLREDEMSIWRLMHAIAELRNDVAHNLEPKRRQPRMDRVRRLYLSEVPEGIAKAHAASAYARRMKAPGRYRA